LQAYWQQWEIILDAMREGQRMANNIKQMIADQYKQSLGE
jgi:hypothetical protein